MNVRHGVLVVALLWASAACAQQDGFLVGGMTVYPTLGITVAYDDNVALAPENEFDSVLTLFSPGVRIVSGTRRSAIALEAAAEFGDYADSDIDDYEDYRVGLTWDYEPTVRSALGARVQWSQLHYRRNEGLRRFFLDAVDRPVDEYETLEWAVRYRYGAPQARGRFAVEVGQTEITFENNRDITAVADSETDFINAEFGFRVAPKTSGLLLAAWQDTSFPNGDRDNEQFQYGLGIDWQATAKTSGRAEVGRREREYDIDGTEYTGSYWLARVEWAPREYSIFSLGTGRDVADAFGESLFLEQDFVELSWRHQWRRRFGTIVETSVVDESLVPGGRNDDVVSFGVSANYQFRRWLQFGASYRYTERDSTEPLANYDQNILTFTAEISP